MHVAPSHAARVGFDVPERAFRPGASCAPRRPTSRVRRAVDLGFAAFAFAVGSDAFTSIGLLGPALGLVYLGGAALIGLALLEGRRPLGGSSASCLVWAFPLVALASVAWSADPVLSLRGAVQLGATCAFGLYIGASLGPLGTLRALALAVGACTALSLLNVGVEAVPAWSQDDYVGSPRFLVGIYNQKNSFGYVLCLLAFSALVAGLRRGPGAAALATLVALGLFPVLRATGSSTAAILFALALVMVAAFAVLGATRSLALTASVGATAATGLLFAAGLAGHSVIELVLDSVGKDATLTGRTEIWAVAAARFLDSPWLGTGYLAFWEASVFSAEVDRVRATVLEAIGNFHNAFIESAVGVGLLGCAALAAALFATTVRALGRVRSALEGGGAALAVSFATFWLLLMLCARSFVEATLYFQHQIDFMLLAAVAAALDEPDP